jgi:hypothetical protein
MMSLRGMFWDMNKASATSTQSGLILMHHTLLATKSKPSKCGAQHPHHTLRQPWNCLPSKETAISFADGALHMQQIKL